MKKVVITHAKRTPAGSFRRNSKCGLASLCNDGGEASAMIVKRYK